MTDAERLEMDLAETLHDAMCDVSHHDRDRRCSRWPRYPMIARSVAPRLAERVDFAYRDRSRPDWAQWEELRQFLAATISPTNYPTAALLLGRIRARYTDRSGQAGEARGAGAVAEHEVESASRGDALGAALGAADAVL